MPLTSPELGIINVYCPVAFVVAVARTGPLGVIVQSIRAIWTLARPVSLPLRIPSLSPPAPPTVRSKKTRPVATTLWIVSEAFTPEMPIPAEAPLILALSLT